jgi:hypothetical protein
VGRGRFGCVYVKKLSNSYAAAYPAPEIKNAIKARHPVSTTIFTHPEYYYKT